MTQITDKLMAGYRAFRSGDYIEQKALYETLGTKGQSPEVMLIACADSRVDPTDIFNARPGEMFVARNVANIVPPSDKSVAYPEVLAAIEYAVTVIKVKMIIIMGHESCGGVAGCLAGMGHDPEAGHVGKWVSLMNDVRERVMTRGLSDTEQQFETELENIRQSIDNLMSYDFVSQAVRAGDLSLQGAYFGIESAQLLWADDQGVFQKVEAG